MQELFEDICKMDYVTPDKVNSVIQNMKQEETVQRLSETFKILGDPTRIKIILALSQEELCVCDIAAILNMTISAISHQLRALSNMRLVKYRKEDKQVFYTLDDEHIKNLFNEGLRHVEEC